MPSKGLGVFTKDGASGKHGDTIRTEAELPLVLHVVLLRNHAAVSAQLTLNREDAAAAGAARVIVHLAGVDARILKHC